MTAPLAPEAAPTLAEITLPIADAHFCKDCKHVYIVEKGDERKPWRWLCKQSPLPAYLSVVTGIYAADPPYERCGKVRRGNLYCEHFDAGPNTLHPRNENDGNA